MKKGLNRTNETTSLLGGDFLIKSVNFEPTESGVKVRNGIGLVSPLDATTQAIIPLAIEKVTISGLEFVLMVSVDGDLYAVIPERYGRVYSIYRRFYQYISTVSLVEDSSQTPPTAAKIIQVSKYIYVLTTSRCAVIAADGLASIITDDATYGDYILVDAWDATIRDADEATPKLYPTDGWSGALEEDTDVFFRIRNEFGGYGAKSDIANIADPQSYLVAGAPGMRSDVWGIGKGDKLVRKIYGFGYRRTNNDTGSEQYRIYFDGQQISDNESVGLVAIESSKRWRNGVATFTGTQLLTVVEGTSIANSVHTSNRNIGTPENYYLSGTQYQVFLIVSQSGEKKLVVKNSVTDLYNVDDYIMISTLITGHNSKTGATQEEKLDMPLLVKITAQNRLSDGASNHQDAWLDTVNNALELQAVTVASEADSAYVYDVEIEGFSEFDAYLEGSRFYDTTGAGHTTYISHTCFGVGILEDGAGNFLHPMIFTEPFVAEPSVYDISMTIDADYMTHDENFWNTYDALSSSVVLQVEFNVDSNGLFLQNSAITRDLLLVYYTDTGTYNPPVENFSKYIDVFIENEEVDLWVAGSSHMLRHDEFSTGSEVAGELKNWYLFKNYPVSLAKWSIYSHGFPKVDVANVGDWSDVAYFNNQFIFADGNQLKIANPLLEWDPTDVITVPENVKSLVPLGMRLMVIAENTIYSLDVKLNLEPMHQVDTEFAIGVNDQLFYLDSNGMMYNTSFAPIPVGNLAQQTKNPYIIVESSGSIIKNDADNWRVYDIISHDNKIYVSSNLGIHIYDLNLKTWWKYELPVAAVIKMIKYDDKIMFFGGDFDNADYVANFSWIGVVGGLS